MSGKWLELLKQIAPSVTRTAVLRDPMGFATSQFAAIQTVAPLLQVTRTVPIVFANVADPVGGGLVDSLARPGGNATGFISFEFSTSGKWLELLKQIAPGVTVTDRVDRSGLQIVKK